MIFSRGSKRSLRFKFYAVIATWISLGFSAADPQKVVLLTSVPTTLSHYLTPEGLAQISPFWRARFETGLESAVRVVESSLRMRMESSRRIVSVIHSADQHDLWQALHDPSVTGVFWVSHASPGEGVPEVPSASAGFRVPPVLADARGYDVGGVLDEIPPGVRFFAVIGCSSSSALDQVVRRSRAAIRSGLQVWTMNRLARIPDDFWAAMDWAAQVIADGASRGNVVGSVPPASGTLPPWRMVVTRVPPRGAAGQPSPAVRVVTDQGHVLGVLPRSAEVQSVSFTLPRKVRWASTPNLTVTAGDYLGVAPFPPQIRTSLDLLGEVAITDLDGRTQWRAFADEHGIPIGQTQVLFEPSGAPGAEERPMGP